MVGTDEQVKGEVFPRREVVLFVNEYSIIGWLCYAGVCVCCVSQQVVNRHQLILQNMVAAFF